MIDDSIRPLPAKTPLVWPAIGLALAGFTAAFTLSRQDSVAMQVFSGLLLLIVLVAFTIWAQSLTSVRDQISLIAYPMVGTKRLSVPGLLMSFYVLMGVIQTLLTPAMHGKVWGIIAFLAGGAVYLAGMPNRKPGRYGIWTFTETSNETMG
ncbi:hypothetical protein BH11ARM1_BH11ARM1_01130 [soil metagenome]